MTADREALKAAVLKTLPEYWGNLPFIADNLADAIVDAVIAVDGQESSVEWGVRSRRAKEKPKVFCVSQDEDWVRYFHNARKGHYELVRRSVGEWQRVT